MKKPIFPTCETLEDRAINTDVLCPKDRIAVRDYIKEVEIGAFQVERGVNQRIKFNVILEVNTVRETIDLDDVDQVLSYDTILEAINHQLQVERLDLLETLAERVAQQILSHEGAYRVFIRIEKLDRISGALGIEIVRTRTKLYGANDDSRKSFLIKPMVIFLPNEILYGEYNQLRAWLDAVINLSKPVVVCVEAINTHQITADSKRVQQRIDLLSIEQNAWVLAGLDLNYIVVGSHTEITWAIKNNQISIWAPSKMVLNAVTKPDLDASALDLAIWFAADFFGTDVMYLGPSVMRDGMQIVTQPHLLL